MSKDKSKRYDYRSQLEIAELVRLLHRLHCIDKHTLHDLDPNYFYYRYLDLDKKRRLADRLDKDLVRIKSDP